MVYTSEVGADVNLIMFRDLKCLRPVCCIKRFVFVDLGYSYCKMGAKISF